MVRYWFPIALVAIFLVALPGLILFTLDLFGYEGELNQWLESTFALSHHIELPGGAAIVLFLIPFLIILLYFLKLKRKPEAIPSTFLWKKSIEDLHVNRLLQWLRRNILLLLQLLIITMLLYAVIAPRLHGSASVGKHYILVIDNSASMGATEGDTTRLEMAKAAALREIDAATDEDTGMVIAFNATAEIRQSYTNQRTLLRQAVMNVPISQQTTRLDEVLSLAESLANPLRSTENEAARPSAPEPGKDRQYVAVEGVPTEVHLFSDGRFPDVPEFALTNLYMRYHSVGDPAKVDNIAIVRLDAQRDEEIPDRVQVEARLVNFRDQPMRGKLKLDVSIDGQLQKPIDRAFEIAPRQLQSGTATEPERYVPGEKVITFELNNIEVNAPVVLYARFDDHRDAMPLDDEAWLVFGIVRKASVLIVGPRNPLLHFFFDGPTTREVAEVTYLDAADLTDASKYLDPARSGKFDLVIFDRCGPATEEEMPTANTLFIGHPPPPWQYEKLERVQFPQVRGWTDAHPIMRGLRGWHDLEIAEAFRLTDLPPRTPRLLEGDRDLVLLAAISRQSYTDLVLTFPLETRDAKWNTRWFLRPLFPLFLHNLIYSAGNIRDAVTEETIRPGQLKRIRPTGVVSEITVSAPNGAQERLERGTRTEFLYGGANEVGIYRITWGDEERKFAVNLFDVEESNLEPRASFRIGAEQVEAGEQRGQPRELWKWLVALALGFVLLEWWVYNRRVFG